MAIQFLCPKCQMLLQAAEEHAGMQTTCPQCETLMVIPQPSGAGDEVPMPPPSPVPSAEPPEEMAEAEAVEFEEVEEVDAAEEMAAIPADDEGEEVAAEPFAERSSLDAHAAMGPAEESPSVGEMTPAETTPSSLQRPPAAAPYFQPMPREFSVGAVLTYGWEIMKANFTTFCLASLVFFGGTSLAALCLFLPVLVVGPILVAVLSALALQAARGKHPEMQDGVSQAKRIGEFLVPMLIWSILVLGCQVPLILIWAVLTHFGGGIAQMVAYVLLVVGSTLILARVGWVPFVLVENPETGIFELFEQSWAISKGHTLDLLLLGMLTHLAILGTALGLCVGVILVGVPIALGVAGGAYVLLDRQWTQAQSPRVAG